MADKINILSTRPLHADLIEEAAEQGIQIDVLSFIDTAPIQTIEVAEEIEQVALLETTVIFTSMNAVDAVTDVLAGEIPAWQIYCIGYTTRKLIAEYFGEDAIAGTADNAALLAETIAEESGAEEVYFFCGDQRRDELPGILSDAGIEVNEITVYETIPTPHKVNKTYAGVLFFSPSAVHSFFRTNKLPDATLVFAIGTTTAAAIKKFTNNTIVVADEPGKESLVQKAIAILTGQ